MKQKTLREDAPRRILFHRKRASERTKQMKKQGPLTSCDTCGNYVYDDEMECYCCDMNLDEDDMVKFLTGSFDNCPYYRLDDEYAVVRHQM